MIPLYSARIDIPARSDSAPATMLYIETTYENPLAGPPKDGKPVIFLLPGGPGSGMSVYKNHSIPLANFAHLVFWDPRGCGKSAKGPVCSYDIETYIDDIEVMREQLCLDEFIPLGTSYGSMAALSYTIKYPAPVSALILGSPVASSEFIKVAKANLTRVGTEKQRQEGENLFAGNFPTQRSVQRFFAIMAPLYSDAAKTEPEESYFNVPDSYNREALVEGFKPDGFLLRYDIVSRLSEISCPTLIMTGARDWINDPSLVRLVADKIAGHVEYHMFDTGHSFAADDNEGYVRTVKCFIENF